MMNATHELKTPIGAISLLAEAVEGAADDPDAVAHFAGKISSEAGRLAALVRQILALSIIQGRPALASALPTDVDARVRDAIERCQTLADGREVSLTVSGQSGLTVFADPEQLGTAIVNLIQNAIQYSEVKARVVVTTKAVTDEVDWVDIAVSDNGIGLSPDDAARVFEQVLPGRLRAQPGDRHRPGAVDRPGDRRGPRRQTRCGASPARAPRSPCGCPRPRQDRKFKHDCRPDRGG